MTCCTGQNCIKLVETSGSHAGLAHGYYFTEKIDYVGPEIIAGDLENGLHTTGAINGLHS